MHKIPVILTRESNESDLLLQRLSRAKVNTARSSEAGIFNPLKPIGFQAFEFRFLARRTLPSRWVVDLSKNDKKILPPQKYIQIPKL